MRVSTHQIFPYVPTPTGTPAARLRAVPPLSQDLLFNCVGKLDFRQPSVWGLGTKPILGLNPLKLPAVTPAAQTPVARVIVPARLSALSKDRKLIEGLREFASLIASTGGKTVKVVNGAAWCAYDSIILYKDMHDPEVSVAECSKSLADLGSGVCGVLAGLFDATWLEKGAVTLKYVAIFGDHCITGNVNLSGSELVELSGHPKAGEYSSVLKLCEVIPQVQL